MSRHHTFPRCTREAPYMGRYRPTHALIATTDRILTVFSWQTGCVPVHGPDWSSKNGKLAPETVPKPCTAQSTWGLGASTCTTYYVVVGGRAKDPSSGRCSMASAEPRLASHT